MQLQGCNNYNIQTTDRHYARRITISECVIDVAVDVIVRVITVVYYSRELHNSKLICIELCTYVSSKILDLSFYFKLIVII